MLRGFIDLPENREKHPAILIVHGGVDTDVTVDPYYEEMRRAFRAAGIATVIWDKAGNGCSSGRYSSALPLQERVSETLAAVAMLQEAGRHRYASNRALGIEPGRMGRSDGSDQVERHCLSHRGEWPRPGRAESGGLSVNADSSAIQASMKRKPGRHTSACAAALPYYARAAPPTRLSLHARASKNIQHFVRCIDAMKLARRLSSRAQGPGVVCRSRRISAAGESTDVGDLWQPRRGGRLAREHRRCLASKRIRAIRQPQPDRESVR